MAKAKFLALAGADDDDDDDADEFGEAVAEAAEAGGDGAEEESGEAEDEEGEAEDAAAPADWSMWKVTLLVAARATAHALPSSNSSPRPVFSPAARSFCITG